MTEKELRKLRRQDLLQLLIMQGRDVNEQADKIEEQQGQITRLDENVQSLQSRLEKKETDLDRLQEQLEELRKKLEQKDELIAKLALRLGDKVEELRKGIPEQAPPAESESAEEQTPPAEKENSSEKASPAESESPAAPEVRQIPDRPEEPEPHLPQESPLMQLTDQLTDMLHLPVPKSGKSGKKHKTKRY